MYIFPKPTRTTGVVTGSTRSFFAFAWGVAPAVSGFLYSESGSIVLPISILALWYCIYASLNFYMTRIDPILPPPALKNREDNDQLALDEELKSNDTRI